MHKRFNVDNIQEALRFRAFPTVTIWNRLEGRPRTENFDRALRAEVRDALWMLTKQWKMGEFHGDDAGSPIFAKTHLTTTQLTKYRAGDQATEVFENEIPFEATVERRPIPFTIGSKNIALDIRLLMGRQWTKMVGKLGNTHRLSLKNTRSNSQTQPAKKMCRYVRIKKPGKPSPPHRIG